ncbi:hypothetical protein D3C75_833710 [compost metagenome]|jgi:arginine deiminase
MPGESSTEILRDLAEVALPEQPAAKKNHGSNQYRRGHTSVKVRAPLPDRLYVRDHFPSRRAPDEQEKDPDAGWRLRRRL